MQKVRESERSNLSSLSWHKVNTVKTVKQSRPSHLWNVGNSDTSEVTSKIIALRITTSQCNILASYPYKYVDKSGQLKLNRSPVTLVLYRINTWQTCSKLHWTSAHCSGVPQGRRDCDRDCAQSLYKGVPTCRCFTYTLRCRVTTW